MAAEGFDWEEIVIDNASSDGTADFIAKEFSEIRLIRNEKNLGFAVPNNQGVAVAKGKYLLFLNPDMRLTEPGSLKKMVDWMETQPEVGIASCKLVFPNGELNPNTKPRRFPNFWEMMLLVLKIPHLFPRVLDRYLMKDFDPTKEQEVDSVRGAFMLMRRELVGQLGWAFDPRYFIWFEDVDACREAYRQGLKVVYTPIISCVDYVGQSFKKKKFWWKQKQFVRSMVKYFWKWR